jgi:hypothetical protein
MLHGAEVVHYNRYSNIVRVKAIMKLVRATTASQWSVVVQQKGLLLYGRVLLAIIAAECSAILIIVISIVVLASIC